MIGRMAGGRERAQRAEVIAVLQTDVNLAPGAGQRDTGVTRAHRPDRPAVIAVIVSERDPRRAAAASQFSGQRFDVVLQCRAGVDQPRRLGADHPRVRPTQCERPGVTGAEADHIVVGQVDPLIHGPWRLRGPSHIWAGSCSERSSSVPPRSIRDVAGQTDSRLSSSSGEAPGSPRGLRTFSDRVQYTHPDSGRGAAW